MGVGGWGERELPGSDHIAGDAAAPRLVSPVSWEDACSVGF